VCGVLLSAISRHLVANNFSDEMRLNGDGVTSGARAIPDPEYENCTSELIEAVNLLPSSSDVLEHCMRLAAVRVSHTSQIRDAKHSHDIAFADRSTVHILDARWLRGRHGT
jgi:hypothetical protein